MIAAGVRAAALMVTAAALAAGCGGSAPCPRFRRPAGGSTRARRPPRGPGRPSAPPPPPVPPRAGAGNRGGGGSPTKPAGNYSVRADVETGSPCPPAYVVVRVIPP